MRQKLEINHKSNARLGLLLAGVGLIGIFNLFLTGFMGVLTISQAGSETLVQLNNGETITAKPTDNLHRTPEVIANFAEETISDLFSFTGYLPLKTAEAALNPQEDPGILIEETNQKVATSTYHASFRLEPQLRKELLIELSKITPQDVFGKGKRVLLVPNYVGKPLPIEDQPGHWTVNVVSTLIAFQGEDPIGEVIPHNKKVYLRAVNPPRYQVNPEAQNSDVFQIIAEARQAGLEIYNMPDLNIEELKNSTLK